MDPDPDLLVIAEPGDELAARLAARAGRAGARVGLVDHRGAAGWLSVRQDGDRVVVRPGCPLFLRAPAAPPAGADQTTAFHHAEIRGLVWAAAALTRAPVVNRPTGDGFAGRITGSGAVLRARVGLPARTEVFVSHASVLGGPRRCPDWWFEHRGTYATYPTGGVLSDRGPYRVGRVPPDCRPVAVCVAGATALDLATGAAHGPLVDASRAVSAALGVRFATLVWRRPAGGEAQLGRVNPYPTVVELGPHLNRVLDAVLAEVRTC